MISGPQGKPLVVTSRATTSLKVSKKTGPITGPLPRPSVGFWQNLRARWGLKSTQKVVMLRSLSVMFRSGVNIDRALDILSSQQENPQLAQALNQIAARVREGRFLSNAMQNFSWLFSNTQVALVAVGEKTGCLDRVLHEIAGLEERQNELSRKLRSSLVMPILISSLCVVMVALAPPILFKPLFQLMKESGASLSWPTQILLVASDAIRSPLSYLSALGALIMGLKGLHLYQTQKEFRRKVLTALHRLPIPKLAHLWRLASLTQFAQSLKTTLLVGIPLLAALKMASESTDDPVFEEDASQVIEAVKNGATLSQAMKGLPSFPSGFALAIGAGEESGSIGAILDNLVQLYSLELETSIEVFTKALEPFMLAVVGGVVCFTVVATMLPMLKIIETL